MSLINWIIVQYDWMIYRLSYNPIRRMCERNPGMALLIELHIQDWRKRNPISKELEESTIQFYNDLKEYKE